MKIKPNSDDDLPLSKKIEIPTMTIVVRAVFMKITNFIHKFSYMNIYINYSYLIRYKAKQIHLLPVYVTNNELKNFCVNNIL